MSIRVLVVDDSAMMRALLRHRLERDPDIEVVGSAANASEARQLIKALNPDVVTLDIEMPGMDGLSFLEKIMQLRPTPVILVSGATEAGASATVRGLQLGAVGCVAKSQLRLGDHGADDDALITLVRAAASVQLRALPHSAPARAAQAPMMGSPAPHAAPGLILIGASTGGVEALHVLLSAFPADCPPTLIVQHINPCFASAIAQSLDRAVAPKVHMAQTDAPLTCGEVLLAPGNDRHLQIARAGSRGWRCVLREGDPVTGHRPSVDRLFASAASALGEERGHEALGILLTGMGQDGAQGMAQLASIGAHTIAQDQASCVVFGMPRAAIELGAVREVLPLERIAPAIFNPARSVPA
jgi:two-component system chemotaxis response regulator CheB